MATTVHVDMIDPYIGAKLPLFLIPRGPSLAYDGHYNNHCQTAIYYRSYGSRLYPFAILFRSLIVVC